jgi:hypothetical protein
MCKLLGASYLQRDNWLRPSFLYMHRGLDEVQEKCLAPTHLILKMTLDFMFTFISN